MAKRKMEAGDQLQMTEPEVFKQSFRRNKAQRGVGDARHSSLRQREPAKESARATAQRMSVRMKAR